MELKENLLLQYQNGKTIRIVFFERLSSIVYAIDMEKVRWPFLINEDELIADYKNKEITILENDPYTRYVIEEELSKSEKKKRNQAWDTVTFIHKHVDSELLVFKSKYRNTAIQRATDSFKVSYNTVKNYLIRYWKGGKIRNGLLPNFNLCGARGTERSVGNKKIGRPRGSGTSQEIGRAHV